MYIGVGMESIHVERMRLAIKRNPKIIDKILSEEEKTALNKSNSGTDSENDKKFISSLSARFAMKIATLRALKLPLFSFPINAIHVKTSVENASPRIFLAEIDDSDSELSQFSFLCSMAHSKKEAVAVVIAQNED